MFSKRFDTVHKEDTLSDCLSIYKEKKPPILIVTDDSGEYEGVIARKGIVRSTLDSSITKVETLMRPAPKAELHDSLSETARLMIGSETMQLPVYSGEKLVGAVTNEDVIHGAILGTWGREKVETIMTKNPFVVREEESVGSALSLLRQHGISQFRAVFDYSA